MGIFEPAHADNWTFAQADGSEIDAARDGTLFALANGTVGVRGSIDELSDDAASFLPDAYDQQAITYHERFAGFARATDTRLSCASGVSINITIDGEQVAFESASIEEFDRKLDFRSGVLSRRTGWSIGDNRLIEIVTERIVPFGQGAVVISRIAVTPINFAARIAIDLPIVASRVELTTADIDDPRISARAAERLRTVDSFADAHAATLLEQTCDGTLFIAVAQLLFSTVAAVQVASGGQSVQRVEANCVAGEPLTVDRFVGFATHPVNSGSAVEQAKTLALCAANAGVDQILDQQWRALDAFWQTATVDIAGAPELTRAIRFNLFHLFQSASRNDAHSVAAKGLTGEGYEGHYFWDTEAYVLPVLALTQPTLARHILMFRFGALEKARANARALNHERGAMYPWRTIAGNECSAHYPTGAAQYHINAAIAYAIETYCSASGDTEFLVECGAEMLFETARLWLDVGHFSGRHDGAFMIHGVTGPDEYSALVNNNFYTNAMAQRHLRYAANTAAWFADTESGAWNALCARIDLDNSEVFEWARAAECMYLPLDAKLKVSPQDDAFLDKPVFDFTAVPAEQRPLLLHYHPMTLFRHQLCKQGDVVQAMVMAGKEFGLGLKARNYAYYEPLTTHDSTLSPSSFSILAAEIGMHSDALRFQTETAFVDIEDRLHNTGHGAHMAAMAGSWLAIVQGWGGMRIHEGEAHLRPVLPREWPQYSFHFAWHGSVVEVQVTAATTRYRLISGAAVTIYDRTRQVPVVEAGYAVAAITTEAVIFDLDGVLTDTAHAHYVAWKQLCDEEGISFDATINERLKGVDRAGSLRIILEAAGRIVLKSEFETMMARKNGFYVDRIASFTSAELFDGARELLERCRRAGLRIALASASRNAPELIARLGIAELFDHVVDAACIAKSKPDPEIFLAAARALGVKPEHCVGVEDAAAGVESILAAGMRAIGIGNQTILHRAETVFASIGELRIDDVLHHQSNAPAENLIHIQ